MTVIDVRTIEVLAADRNAALPRDGNILALLRCGGTPIGQASITLRGLTPPGVVIANALTFAHAERALTLALGAWVRRTGNADAATVTGAFAALREEFADEQSNILSLSPGQSAPRISVAICSRDRPQQLARAVDAVRGTLGPHDELLVVLNAPSDSARSFDRDRFPTVRVVEEYRPGLSWARNRAIAEFHGDVLLFTDDDCVPDAQWVAAHRALFARNPDVDVVTGLVEPLVLDTPAQQLFEAYGGFPRTYTRRWIMAPDQRSIAGLVGNVGEFGVGANLAVRRRVFDSIGPFDAALGPGTICRAGDDAEYLFRALKSGMLLGIEPRAVVRHEHRRSMDALTKQVAGWSRGFACAMARSTLAFPEERNAFSALRLRIGLFHHVRRALRYPKLRQLAITELQEMRGALACYENARVTANRLSAAHSSSTEDALPTRVRHHAAWSATSTHPEAPLRRDDGVVGTDRLEDETVSVMTASMRGNGWRHAIQQSLTVLQTQACAAAAHPEK